MFLVPSRKKNLYKVILALIGVFVLVMGTFLFFNPPSLSTDPSQGFQVLRSMEIGSSFNTLISPDQSNISKNYAQFYTWWSPGQFLVPYFVKLITGLTMGKGIAITVTLAQLCGLAGLYFFFRKIGFTKNIAAVSLVFILCQQAFMIPDVEYNGGETLIFSFLGWFLYGCVTLNKTGLQLLCFVLFSAFIGFFLKSSFLWIYAAGLFCLWVRLCADGKDNALLMKKTLWIGIPAVIAFVAIYIFYISKGESPATVSYGYKLKAETFAYPLASPLLSGFSIDDLVNGLMEPSGKQLFSYQTSVVILVIISVLSVLMILGILRFVPDNNYRLFLIVFYSVAILFFGFSYWHQLDISMEPRHFRVIGLLITPGVFYLVARFKPAYKFLFVVVFAGIAYNSFSFLIRGYRLNKLQARGILGIAQPNIDQVSLNRILKLDREQRNLTFVLVGDDIGLELMHNRIIPLQPIGEDLKIDAGDYTFDGHAGPLYIVMPETYIGAREKIILKSFPGYKNFNHEKLSKGFELYSAR